MNTQAINTQNTEAMPQARQNEYKNMLMARYNHIRGQKTARAVSIRFDADVLAYFKAKGRGYQAMMNDALRAFMEVEMARKA